MLALRLRQVKGGYRPMILFAILLGTPRKDPKCVIRQRPL
jgi:hypothetical protein